MSSWENRVQALDWHRLRADLESQGHATTGPLLSPEQAIGMREQYRQETLFRSRVVMEQHGYGRGEYQYYAHPLPDLVAGLRSALYAPLVATANDWNARMRIDTRFPATLPGLLARCHAAGQTRPTPLLLKYGPGDHNCLHQDLYGELVFPLQVAVLLSAPDTEFTGGEFVLVEQRPRRQGRVHVVPLRQGEGVIFAVNQRPVPGSRGDQRAQLRHGVSALRSGERHTLGLIFHDAR